MISLYVFVNKSFAGYTLDNIQFNMGSSIDIPKFNGIEEAPIDGKVYSRSDKNWVENTGGGTLQQVIDVGNTAKSPNELSNKFRGGRFPEKSGRYQFRLPLKV